MQLHIGFQVRVLPVSAFQSVLNRCFRGSERLFLPTFNSVLILLVLSSVPFEIALLGFMGDETQCSLIILHPRRPC